MKLLLLTLCVLFISGIKAQNAFSLKVQNRVLAVNLDEDNTDKVLTINSRIKKYDKLVIYNLNKQEKKDWKRTFTIYDSLDSELIKMSTPTKSIYEITVTKLLTRLQKDKTYFLYTFALPVDPRKAALIRVGRVLLCKVRVK